MNDFIYCFDWIKNYAETIQMLLITRNVYCQSVWGIIIQLLNYLNENENRSKTVCVQILYIAYIYETTSQIVVVQMNGVSVRGKHQFWHGQLDRYVVW